MSYDVRSRWLSYSNSKLEEILTDHHHVFWLCPSSIVRKRKASIQIAGKDLVKNICLSQLASMLGIDDCTGLVSAEQLLYYRQLLIDIPSPDSPLNRIIKRFSKGSLKKAITVGFPWGKWEGDTFSLWHGVYRMDFHLTPDVERYWRIQLPNKTLFACSLETILSMSNGDYRDLYTNDLESVVRYYKYATEQEFWFIDNILKGEAAPADKNYSQVDP